MKAICQLPSFAGKISKILAAAVIIITLHVPATAGDNPRPEPSAKGNVTSVLRQIQQLLPANLTVRELGGNESFVVSFTLDENGRMANIRTYSQNAQTEEIIIASLSGKKIHAPHLAANQIHSFRMRVRVN
jgi:hypothetical protein